ncbi:MAG TPA: glycosyltransferase [Candidatus Saccharimonadales bacterium]
MKKPDVSIVVIDKSELGIADTLDSFKKLKTSFTYEVVVVDASGGLFDAIAAAHPEARWVPFVSKTKKRFTIPEQRNAGVTEAKADIIAFTDANCIAQPDWLERLVAPIKKDDEALVAGLALSQAAGSIYDQDHAHRKGQKYIRECPTINLAFTREAYEKIGGFDERFDYGSDVDFSWRANDLGFKVRYVPEAIISHDWGSASDNMKRSYRYGVARARLYKKHPRRWRELCTADVITLIYPAYILGLPLTYWFWPYPLLIVVPLYKNRHLQPFKVVQKHLIYGCGVLRELVRL